MTRLCSPAWRCSAGASEKFALRSASSISSFRAEIKRTRDGNETREIAKRWAAWSARASRTRVSPRIFQPRLRTLFPSESLWMTFQSRKITERGTRASQTKNSARANEDRWQWIARYIRSMYYSRRLVDTAARLTLVDPSFIKHQIHAELNRRTPRIRCVSDVRSSMCVTCMFQQVERG